jgi:hypothetical protein
MVPSLFHRHTHTHTHTQPQGLSDSSSQPATYRSGMAMSGLAAFSSSGLPPRPNLPNDSLAFVPYTAPIRPREAQAMGDLSYELAHPSKFSDWTDDGDEHALPPPSLGIALLSKARAAIKARLDRGHLHLLPHRGRGHRHLVHHPFLASDQEGRRSPTHHLLCQNRRSING